MNWVDPDEAPTELVALVSTGDVVVSIQEVKIALAITTAVILMSLFMFESFVCVSKDNIVIFIEIVKKKVKKLSKREKPPKFDGFLEEFVFLCWWFDRNYIQFYGISGNISITSYDMSISKQSLLCKFNGNDPPYIVCRYGTIRLQ